MMSGMGFVPAILRASREGVAPSPVAAVWLLREPAEAKKTTARHKHPTTARLHTNLFPGSRCSRLPRAPGSPAALRGRPGGELWGARLPSGLSPWGEPALLLASLPAVAPAAVCLVHNGLRGHDWSAQQPLVAKGLTQGWALQGTELWSLSYLIPAFEQSLLW